MGPAFITPAELNNNSKKVQKQFACMVRPVYSDSMISSSYSLRSNNTTEAETMTTKTIAAMTNRPIIRTDIPIKYKHGHTTFLTHNASTAMCRQALAAIQDELRAVAGEYIWSLEGDTGAWHIRATYDGGHFHECCDCKTAVEAMLSVHAIFRVLMNHDSSQAAMFA